MATDWQLRDVPLHFHLSVVPLFVVNTRLQSREFALADDLAPVAEPLPPDDPRERGSEGFILRSLPVAGPLPTLGRSGAYLYYVPDQYQRCYIDLRQSFADYRQQFATKTRETIERKVRRYARACGGEIRWQAYQSPVDMTEFYRLARAVSARSYQEQRLNMGLPATEKFFRGMLDLAAAGQVRGYLLFSGDRPVSYLYCPDDNGTLRYAYVGYDPDFAHLSVGTVLLWLALQSLFAEQSFCLFDFTEGQSEHKRIFSTHHRRCANVFFLRPTPRNLALVQAHRALQLFSRGMADFLEATGCRARVRRLIRFGRSRIVPGAAPP